jgi:hypothetical protein
VPSSSFTERSGSEINRLTLSWLVFGTCFIIGLIDLRRARRAVALLESQRHKRFELPWHPPRFVVFVPLLREQAVV